MSSLLLSPPPHAFSSLSSTPSYHGSLTPACSLLYFVVEVALAIFVVFVAVVSVAFSIVAVAVANIAVAVDIIYITLLP